MNSVLLNLCALALFSIVSFTQATDTSCTDFINRNVCNKRKHSLDSAQEKGCSALYEGFSEIQPKIRKYINQHIINSFQYTLLSTNFGNHQTNRPGFEALHTKLSDETWEDAIELIKYNAKRGGHLENYNDFRSNDFRSNDLKTMLEAQKQFPISEYNSLATALDMHKELAAGAHDIHKEAVRLGQVYHDPEVSSFIENEFVHKHSKTIRSLAGHLADMNAIMSEYQEQHGGTSLSLYLFDEYLQKSLGVSGGLGSVV
ncbi:hypothetical protein WDU94_012695 [Cyamophila willieti]